MAKKKDAGAEPGADWSGKRFRKLPVMVEAVQIGEIKTVSTPFGPTRGMVGDWLITAADGQQWFCTDEYFRENYEPVREGEPEAG